MAQITLTVKDVLADFDAAWEANGWDLRSTIGRLIEEHRASK